MIKINRRNETFKYPAPLTVREALSLLGLTEETHLVTRNGFLLSPDEVLEDGDEVTLVATISGGCNS